MFRKSNDPDYPGERELDVEDVLLIIELAALAVSAVVWIYAAIWHGYHTRQVSATVFVSALLALAATLGVASLFKKEEK